MKKFFQISFILILALLLQNPGIAQEITKNKVAFHDDIYRITKGMEQKIDYFSEKYPSFNAAELFRIDEERYQIEIEQIKNDEVSITSRELTESEFQSMRREIAKRIVENEIVSSYDQSGRFLKVQSISTQGMLGGLTVSALTAENTQNYGITLAMPYLGLGAGILGGIWGTANRDVPLAPAMGYASGGSMGSLHGLMVGHLLSGENSFSRFSTYMLSSTAFSVGESLLLQHIVKKNNMNAKRASALRLGNLAGGISGFGMSILLGGDSPNKYLSTAFTLGGSAAGIYLLDKYYKNKDIGVGNLQAIRLMNPIFTAGATIVIADLGNIESTAIGGLTILASSVGGLFLGEALFKNGQVTYSESLWYGVGLYGGYYLGTGLTTLFLTSTTNYSNLGAGIAGIMTLCSLGGMYLVHSLVSNGNDDNEIGFLEKNNIHISANPTSLYVNKYIDSPHYQQNTLSIRWTF